MKKAYLRIPLPGLNLIEQGKVRDIYDFGDKLLIVTSDAISAFDVVMIEGIPGKGIVLNQATLHWCKFFEGIVPNHIITADVDKYPEECRPFADILRDRSMLVWKCQPLKGECIVRGYVSGSGWKSYKKDGTICGIQLPPGLLESDKLPIPLFTPSTKAGPGQHDENISFEKFAKLVGEKNAHDARRICLEIYSEAAKLALAKGIIIADTKFELGLLNGRLVLIDEVLTPDSSRFWPVASYKPGGPQPSFDKQYLRDYLEGLDWDKTPPPPPLPEEVRKITGEKYDHALKIIESIN